MNGREGGGLDVARPFDNTQPVAETRTDAVVEKSEECDDHLDGRNPIGEEGSANKM